jgi:hypothetical protein
LTPQYRAPQPHSSPKRQSTVLGDASIKAIKQFMQNVRTTVLSDDEDERQKVRKIFFFSFGVACLFRRRTLVVGALVHHLEHLGVLVNHSRCGNRRRRRHR